MKHVVFNQDTFRPTIGGAGGYNSRLYRGWTENKIECADIDFKFMFADDSEGRYPKGEVLESTYNDDGYADFLQMYKEFKSKYNGDWGTFDNIMSTPSTKLIDQMDLNNITSVHIHGAYDFFRVYNILKKCNIHDKVVKILTTHSPIPHYEEIYEDDLISKYGDNKQYCDDLRELLMYRDIKAFEMADVLVFPHPEAIQSYYEYNHELGEIIDSKPKYYFLTGSAPYVIKSSMMDFRIEHNIPINAKVVGYIGRHVKARGYDILKKSAMEVWKNNPDIYYVIAGGVIPNGEQPLNDKRWIEIGYTNSPGDFINSLDLVIQPSKHNFFDLSMIEILSTGKPVLTSYVGGMKYFCDNSEGVMSFERGNSTALAKAVLDMFLFDDTKVEKMKESNLDLYRNHHTEECFAKNYKTMIEEIYKHERVYEPDNRHISVIIKSEQVVKISEARYDSLGYSFKEWLKIKHPKMAKALNKVHKKTLGKGKY